MADPQRIRNITFKTPAVTAKLISVKRESWEIVAKEMDTIVHATLGKNVGRRRGKRGGRIVVRSKPGEPPRRDTGFLHDNTGVDYDPKKSRVVLRTPTYGGWLHGGTRRVAARPWIDVVFIVKRGRISLQPTWRNRHLEVMKTLVGNGSK